MTCLRCSGDLVHQYLINILKTRVSLSEIVVITWANIKWSEIMLERDCHDLRKACTTTKKAIYNM